MFVIRRAMEALVPPHLQEALISHRYNQPPLLGQQLCSSGITGEPPGFSCSCYKCALSSSRVDSADH